MFAHYKDSSSEDAYSEEEEAQCNANSSNQRKKKKSPQEERLRRLQAAGKCFLCNDKGHLARDCPKKKKGAKKNEVVEEESGED